MANEETVQTFITRKFYYNLIIIKFVYLVDTALTISSSASLEQATHENIHVILRSFWKYAYCFTILFLYGKPLLRHY